MAEMRIRIGAEDIERLALGAAPSEAARLEFRNTVLAAYAEAHIKPLENSPQMEKLKEAISVGLDKALGAYILEHRQKFASYTLRPEIKKLIEQEVGKVFMRHLDQITNDAHQKFAALEKEVRAHITRFEQRVEKALLDLINRPDSEAYIYEVFTNALNEQFTKFIKGRTLAELENLANKRLAPQKEKG